MAQYDVLQNTDGASRRAVPYLLDIQSDLLDALSTRVVVPLAVQGRGAPPPMSRLMPVFEIEGRACTMVTPQLAGVPRTVLGQKVASLAHARHEIVAALDVLISGV